jgi:hypothetical protein
MDSVSGWGVLLLIICAIATVVFALRSYSVPGSRQRYVLSSVLEPVLLASGLSIALYAAQLLSEKNVIMSAIFIPLCAYELSLWWKEVNRDEDNFWKKKRRNLTSSIGSLFSKIGFNLTSTRTQ